MRIILKKYFVVFVSLASLTQLIPGITISGGLRGYFSAAFYLSLILYIASPIGNLIALPINFLTLNLFSWLIHILLIAFWILLVPEVTIVDWQFTGFTLGPLSLSPAYFSKIPLIIIVSFSITILTKVFQWLVS